MKYIFIAYLFDVINIFFLQIWSNLKWLETNLKHQLFWYGGSKLEGEKDRLTYKTRKWSLCECEMLARISFPFCIKLSDQTMQSWIVICPQKSNELNQEKVQPSWIRGKHPSHAHKKLQELLNHLAWNQWNKQLSTLVLSLEGNSFTGKNVLPRPCSCNLQQQKQTAIQFLFWTKTYLHLKTNKINVEWLASFPFLYQTQGTKQCPEWTKFEQS
jgi:hypothetical protein